MNTHSKNALLGRRLTLLALLTLILVYVAPVIPTALAAPAAGSGEYQIYPTPQQISYGNATVHLTTRAHVVVDDGIGQDTKNRLNEVLALKNITADAPAASADHAQLQIFVGIRGSGGTADTYAQQLKTDGVISFSDDLFTGAHHHDAYLLATVPGTDKRPASIIVLGKDTDSAFYGLTTLYRIFQQAPDSHLRQLTVQDYADVVTRGFIEGYYGNPWSTNDRVELMRWGGYQKLNAYIYAPKDDPKHNRKWRELYTEDELVKKIEPLATAGNGSKVRFVFALHPFMESPITVQNYDDSVSLLKKKFTQVMDHGVRQIAILADDARDQGQDLYTKLLKDMTAWLTEKQAEKNADGSLKYPGLKKTLIFCPVHYMGSGEAWYKQLPTNVQIINTGGRVWGKVTKEFTEKFQANSGGRAPFYWINWPCSDNDKDALHMGGHNSFLGTNVKPGSVDGVVLNPMQQSEPSKLGIFMNADFSWRLWTSTAHADQVWADAFAYVDHNSPVATKASTALRNLSEHMRRGFGGGMVFENNESASVHDQVLAFQNKVSSGTATAEDIEAIASVFASLAKDAKTYRTHAGTPRMLEQITPWIGAWDDFTVAAGHYFAAYRAALAHDKQTLIDEYFAAEKAMAAYRGHGFNYIDHTEYAQVAKMYLAPMLNTVSSALLPAVTLLAGADADLTAYVTSRTDLPAGGTPVSAAYDDFLSTKLVYKTPNTLTAGTFFGLIKSKPFTLTSVKFVQGGGKDFIEHAKLQALDPVHGWVDVAGQDNLTGTTVEIYGLNVPNVHGVRLIATRDNSRDAWPTIAEITINPAPPAPEPAGHISSVDTRVYNNNGPQYAQDNDENTRYYIYSTKGNWVSEDNPVVLTFDEPALIDSALFMQGFDKDMIQTGVLEYSADGTGNWIKLADVTGDIKQKFTFDPVMAKAIRLRPSQLYNNWWKVVEFHAYKHVAHQDSADSELTSVSPLPPEFVNPSAHDPSDCDTVPFVKIPETAGVNYTVIADGKHVLPDSTGKYVYPYGVSVNVHATPADGYTLVGTSEWTFTAQQATTCQSANGSADPAPHTPGAVADDGGDPQQADTPEQAGNQQAASTPDKGATHGTTVLSYTGAAVMTMLGVATLLVLAGVILTSRLRRH
ncbi:beta-N-acetylglucosaminidase domain-containing protein [Trueperella pyogenes]|uniref:beta-N-acetylglucosaminidase domain-containing protein n=1 Tax=Trueperella pyogenes TaxID=1661 RepID=UPI00345D8730